MQISGKFMNLIRNLFLLRKVPFSEICSQNSYNVYLFQGKADVNIQQMNNEYKKREKKALWEVKK